MNIPVSINSQQWHDLHRFLASRPQRIPRAAASAINRTVATGATRIRRELARMIKMPVRQFGKRVKPIKTDSEQLSGAIRLYNFNIPLIKTRVTPVKGGSYPLEKKADPIALANGPFKATMKSGHTGWYVRYGPKRMIDPSKMTDKSLQRYGTKLRQPIKQVFAPAPRKLWEESPGVAAAILSDLGDVLEKNVQSQIDRFLAN